MKQQIFSFDKYISRVGGISLAYFVAILLAKFFYPGSELIAIFVVSGFAILFLIIEALKKRRNSQKKLLRVRNKKRS
jgi:hypothetical protein